MPTAEGGRREVGKTLARMVMQPCPAVQRFCSPPQSVSALLTPSPTSRLTGSHGSESRHPLLRHVQQGQLVGCSRSAGEAFRCPPVAGQRAAHLRRFRRLPAFQPSLAARREGCRVGLGSGWPQGRADPNARPCTRIILRSPQCNWLALLHLQPAALLQHPHRRYRSGLSTERSIGCNSSLASAAGPPAAWRYRAAR